MSSDKGRLSPAGHASGSTSGRLAFYPELLYIFIENT